jgi:hypothetical protein
MAKATPASLRKSTQKTGSRLNSRERWILGLISFFLLGALGFIRWATLPHTADTERTEVPPFLAQVTDPLPTTLKPNEFTDPIIREAYQVAANIPAVLAQQPCYCGCSQIGHRSLLDCYRSDHAATCDICVKETLLANRMHEASRTADEIRAAIIAGQWTQIK